MRILLIEDEITKEQDILRFLHEANPETVVEVRRSITAGIAEIREQQYDYILLDMSLPLYDNEDGHYMEDNEFETFGGNYVLDELDRIEYSVKVVVITAFDILGEGQDRIELTQVEKGLYEDYPDVFIGTIFYNASSVEWKNKLNTSSTGNHDLSLSGRCAEFGFGFDITWGTDWPYSDVFWRWNDGIAEKINIDMGGTVRTPSIDIKVNDTNVYKNGNCDSHSAPDFH